MHQHMRAHRDGRGSSWLSILRAAWAGIDPEGYFHRQATRTAPFTLRFPGLGEVLFVSTMEGARDVLTAPALLCQAPRPSLIEPIVGKDSLILLSGEHHRRVRSLLTPGLRGERMPGYVEVIANATAEAVEGLQEGDNVAVRELAQAITLDVIIRAVFGITDPDRRQSYAESIKALMRANTAPLMLMPALRREFSGFGPWSRLVKCRDQLDRLLTEDIIRRQDGDLESRDMLGLLITATDEHGRGLSRQEMCQQLRTLLAAGHETTATALGWAMYHIHSDDAVRERLLEELSTATMPQDIVELPYLQAVISETLRMHPTVSIVLRRLAGPLTVNGIERGAGDVVGIALPALHFNPTLWPDPERFDPDRFLKDRPSSFQYAPFGGGHRRCIGASFAKCELAVVIGTILNTVHLQMSEQERRTPPRAVPRGIAVVPNRSIVLKVVDRSPSYLTPPTAPDGLSGESAMSVTDRRTTIPPGE